MTFSEYMQQALVEAIRFDIEEGNFCDVLLERLGIKDAKNDISTSSFAPDLINSDLDLLKKLQTHTS
jgi:hypothetical protein